MKTQYFTNQKFFTLSFFFAAILLYLTTRFFNLTILPIFTDEAVYIRWAKMINENIYNILIPIKMDNKKPLLMWLIAGALNIFQDPLWAARLVSVTAGFFSLMAIYLIGYKLHSIWVGCISVLLYIFSPYHLFYDRIAHQASLLNCFFLWMIWLTLKLMLNEEKIRIQYYLILGLVIGLSLMTKATAALFVFIPLISKLIFFRKNTCAPWKSILSSYLFGLIIAGVPYAVLFCSYSNFSVKNIFIPTTHGDAKGSIADLLFRIPKNIYYYIGGSFDYFVTYLTYPILLLAFVFLAFQFKSWNKKHFIILFYFLIPFFLLVGFTGRGFSRYFLFCGTPILIWAALALHCCAEILIKRLPQKIFYITMIIILSILFSPTVKFNYKLLTRPFEAPLIGRDYGQYIRDEFSGYGMPEAIDFFKKASRNQKIIIFTTNNWGNPADSIYAYLSDYPNIKIVKAFWVFEKELLAEEAQIKNISEVYFICRSPAYSRSLFLMTNKNFQLIKSFGKPNSTVFVDIYKHV